MSNSTTLNVQHDIWKFIRQSKATQSASLKSLQSFVLSLNKQSLRHLIESFLVLKLTKYHQRNGLDLNQCYDKLINNATNNSCNDTLNETDIDILNKLDNKFGNKRNKKIIKKTQQNHHEHKNHLLSLNSTILSYSFQFLEYKQQCKSKTVCTYFLYSLRTFTGISNYFINLNQKFFLKIFKNQINVNNLTQFKHIRIACSYFWNVRCLYKKIVTKAMIFAYILKHIILKSKSCLKILEIDIGRSFGTTDKQNVLSYILSEFDSLPITKLIWTKEPSRFSNRSINQIKTKIGITFPELKQFECQINEVQSSYAGNWLNQRLVSRTPLLSISKCIIPVITNYNKLESLNLHFPSWNVLANQQIFKLLILNPNLKKLFICSAININDIDYGKIITNNNNNKSLQELGLKLIVDFEDPIAKYRKLATFYLSNLFSWFTNINSFSFGIFSCMNWQNKWRGINLNMDWQNIFDKLILDKNKHNLNALISLEITYISHNDAMDIIKALKNIKDDKHINLKNFSINVMHDSSMKFDVFMNEQFVPLLKLYNNNCDDLNDISVSYGSGDVINDGGYTLSRDWKFHTLKSCTMSTSNLCNKYYTALVHLLSSIPKTVKRFKITLPNLSNQGFCSNEWQNQSMNVSKTLCQNAVNKDSKLEQIQLTDLKLHKKAEDFLIFWFGHNRKLLQTKNTFFISFIE